MRKNVSGWAAQFIEAEPKNVTPPKRNWLREKTDAWHAETRTRALAAKRQANQYGLAFIGLFVVIMSPGPSWLHWTAFWVGAWCGSRAFASWSIYASLLPLTKMEPDELMKAEATESPSSDR